MSARFDLRAARLNRGLTQRALAAEAGVSLTTVQRLEEGLGARPANAKRLADFLEVQATDLLPADDAKAAA